MRCLLLLSMAAVADSVLTEGVIDPNDLLRRTTDDPPRKYLRPRADMPKEKKQMSRAYGQIKSFKGQYERGQARRIDAIRSREATFSRMEDTRNRELDQKYRWGNAEYHRNNARKLEQRKHKGESQDGKVLATRIQVANAYHKGAHMAFPRQRVPFGPPAKVQEAKPLTSRYPTKVGRHKRHPTEHPADPMGKKHNSRVPYHEQQELFRQAYMASRADDAEEIHDADVLAEAQGHGGGALLADHLEEADQQGGQPANSKVAPEVEVVEAKTNDDPSDNDVNQLDDTPPAMVTENGDVEIPGAAEAAEKRQDALEAVAEAADERQDALEGVEE